MYVLYMHVTPTRYNELLSSLDKVVICAVLCQENYMHACMHSFIHSFHPGSEWLLAWGSEGPHAVMNHSRPTLL